MMAPLLERLRPTILVYPMTLWSLDDDVDWDLVRFYDPAVAVSVLGWRELAREHDEHFSGLLEYGHVVLRHRDAIRRTVGAGIGKRWKGGAEGPPRLLFAHVQERADERRGRVREDFDCPSVHTRALGYLATRLREAGTQMIVVATPVLSRWQHDERLTAMMDNCMQREAAAHGYRYVPVASSADIRREHFRDSLHMNEAGRERFTALLTRTVAGPLHTMRAREKHAVR